MSSEVNKMAEYTDDYEDQAYGGVFNHDFDKFHLHENSIWSNDFTPQQESDDRGSEADHLLNNDDHFLQEPGSLMTPSHYEMNEMSGYPQRTGSPKKYEHATYEEGQASMLTSEYFDSNYSMGYNQLLPYPNYPACLPQATMDMSDSPIRSPMPMEYISAMPGMPMLNPEEMMSSQSPFDQKGIK